MVYALVHLSYKRTWQAGGTPAVTEGSVETFDMWLEALDLAEYLVNTTSRMDREWKMINGQGGADASRRCL